MRAKVIFSLFGFLFLLSACPSNTEPSIQKDISDSLLKVRHSYSNPDQVRLDSLHLSLHVDFEKKELMGSAKWMIGQNSGSEHLILDFRSIDIREVEVDGEPVEVKITKSHPVFGQGLKIPIEKDSKEVEIFYSTRDEAEALQWMSPEQTSGGMPFLYTQSQAILARSWVPCMDVPENRFSYSAIITCDTVYTALMSAENVADSAGYFQFAMNQKIPSYLLALAVGELEYEAYNDQCGVYAEPVVLDKAFSELKDLPAMIKAAEALYGPYQWGKYDVLFLPSSFPFGGMENPRLTFATPTILAGDGSLVALVAHELAHSWSGNLVTNRTWNDFWLNEGFTVYFEQRIMESVYGKQYADMLQVLGHQDLMSTLEELGPDHPDSRLYLDLYDRDPDEGVSDIAYEKGRFFLLHLERLVGRNNFDAFLKNYFTSHAFQTMTTEAFLEELKSNLLSKNPEWLEQARVHQWVYESGIPDDFVAPVSTEFIRVDSLRSAILAGDQKAIAQTENWTTHHWLRFIRGIDAPADTGVLSQLEKQFAFSKANAEIADRWFVLAVQSDWRTMQSPIEAFLLSIGRRKFLTPLYGAMNKGSEFWQKAGRKIYKKARPGYHAVSTHTLDELLDH
ncbi:MAG: M1 family metallopeptidase [Bacteroidota bacterium]|nr:M1 family metallopeptidase [Bacteroidota bacterium]MDX5431534.1 M1 family metallopeptidase [Bacteroidota bacterium]MDX5470255.1 M1 family metallopeptidase [Bacteroidota bacterium]